MKKNLKIILGLGCLAFLFAGAACKEKTKEEELRDQGYAICVSYDANGGSFLNRPGVTIQDWIDPAKYQKDSEGVIHVKLLEPTDPSRPTSGSDKVTLTKANYFFAGWYKTREVKLVNGVPVDGSGRELKLKEDGTYVYAELGEEEEEASVTPAYVYSDYWNFETDTFDYSEDDGDVSMTLYAGWVPFYEFNYYYEENGVWTKLAQTTTFDFKTTNAVGSATADKDTIWLPCWNNGAMQYNFEYADKSPYKFPNIEGTTFAAAYLDEACTQQITTESFEHQGTLELETCTAVNRVQNIYIKATEGVQYYISNAEQLIEYADPDAYYEIMSDLDFKGRAWPTAFETGTFTGKMYATEGNNFTLRNVVATHSSQSSLVGGLFGEIAKGAEIRNLTFDNATLDLVYTGQRLRDTSFGLFAGIIYDGAIIENVAIGGTFKIGAITLGDGYSFNLYANGDITGLTTNEVALQIYGTQLGDLYNFTVLPYDPKDPEKKTITVDAEYNISVTFDTSELYEEEIYNIDYTI